MSTPTIPRPRGGFDPSRAARDLDACRADARGQRAHLICAIVSCVLIVWPTTWAELAPLPLLIAYFVRARHTFRTARWAVRQPVMLALVVFAAWQAVSLLWSPDPRLGAEQLGAMRWVYLVILLYPVLDRRGWLVAALCVGFLAGNASQVLHAAGRVWGVEAITWPRLPDRNSGWWDPVVGGTLLVGALGLHLGGLIGSAGRVRVLSACGALITLVAIGATGTRGAWLAAAGLLGVAFVVAAVAWRRAAGRVPRGRMIACVAAALAVLVGAVVVLGPGIARRGELAYADVRGAIERRDFTSDTGARLIMGWWALGALREHPLGGVGAGGYRAWVHERLRAQGVDPATRSTHDHAHNALLHIAATTGLPGVGAALAVVALALHASVRAARRIGGFAALGPTLALIGLLGVSLFDAVHINAQTAALLAVLIALSPARFPMPDLSPDPGPRG